jgi:hypothetical protein
MKTKLLILIIALFIFSFKLSSFVNADYSCSYSDGCESSGTFTSTSDDSVPPNTYYNDYCGEDVISYTQCSWVDSAPNPTNAPNPTSAPTNAPNPTSAPPSGSSCVVDGGNACDRNGNNCYSCCDCSTGNGASEVCVQCCIGNTGNVCNSSGTNCGTCCSGCSTGSGASEQCVACPSPTPPGSTGGGGDSSCTNGSIRYVCGTTTCPQQWTRRGLTTCSIFGRIVIEWAKEIWNHQKINQFLTKNQI